MRKFLLVICLFLCPFMLTGCGGNKTVSCEGNITESGVTAAVKVTGDFNGNKLAKQTIEMKFDLTDYLEYADIDTYYESFKEQYSQFDEYEGISTDVTKGDNAIIVVMEVETDKIDESTYKKLDIGNGSLKVSSAEFIKEFTDMDMTCK